MRLEDADDLLRGLSVPLEDALLRLQDDALTDDQHALEGLHATPGPAGESTPAAASALYGLLPHDEGHGG